MSCIQYWLFGVSIGAVMLAGVLSLLGGRSTRSILEALRRTAVMIPRRKPEDVAQQTEAISIVDLDLQLEHHQRGRCIVQSGLLLFAVVAIICATVLGGSAGPQHQTPAKKSCSGDQVNVATGGAGKLGQPAGDPSKEEAAPVQTSATNVTVGAAK